MQQRQKELRLVQAELLHTQTELLFTQVELEQVGYISLDNWKLCRSFQCRCVAAEPNRCVDVSAGSIRSSSTPKRN